MPMTTTFAATEPKRADIDSRPGSLVIEFGTPWCGFCQRAQPLIETAFREHADLDHIKVEDGSGRPLGRSFRVKLWPTLIFMRDGQEVARLVRPESASDIADAMAKLG
ncbi:thioredoxin family protein [Cupriavidus sp. DL-D2]|uniref:thioredoxin family protein n=1 Tax=Cupriavidus sp. DL-D2 TaxID=3144974 RepID=UPI003215DE7F